MNLVISHAPSADNSNLSADGDDSFISVEMDSAMPSPFSEVRESRRGVIVSLPKWRRRKISVIYDTDDGNGCSISSLGVNPQTVSS